jgi:hypothetical protein
LKHIFLDLEQVAFRVGQKTEYEFAGHVDPLKHRFLDLEHVLFCVVLLAENEITRQVNALKYRIFDFAQVTFWRGKMQNICSECQSTQ